ncbi:MAG: ribonuclease HI [candidate division KSB1 bacterium]|nr:ribonuclease HI [candidate division KSB1 bacterium]
MPKKRKYYAVARGKTPGIYTEWSGPQGAKQQVEGFPAALYKGFYDLEDAVAWFEYLGIKVPKEYEHIKPETETPKDILLIYTDGCSLDNPGPGGYGAVLLYHDSRKELSGGYRLTTNNRMELMACIAALESLKQPSEALLRSDSKYVVDAVLKGRLDNWQQNRWRKKGETIPNADLWQTLWQQIQRHTVTFEWVKGHGGKKENERCDALAVTAAREAADQIDEGYENRGKGLER